MMSLREVNIYPTKLQYWLNSIFLPAKLIIPQPVVQKIPFATSNKDIRSRLILNEISGKLLDIGCGDNFLVQQYRERGGEGVGVDVYPWPGCEHVVENTASLPFEDDSFDAVTFVACLNHIPNREEVLVEARRVLRKDGVLALTNMTPFISSVWHAIAFWDEDQHERGMEDGEVWGFAHDELVSMLEEAGFRVDNYFRFSMGLNSVYVCKQA